MNPSVWFANHEQCYLFFRFIACSPSKSLYWLPSSLSLSTQRQPCVADWSEREWLAKLTQWTPTDEVCECLSFFQRVAMPTNFVTALSEPNKHSGPRSHQKSKANCIAGETGAAEEEAKSFRALSDCAQPHPFAQQQVSSHKWAALSPNDTMSASALLFCNWGSAELAHHLVSPAPTWSSLGKQDSQLHL